MLVKAISIRQPWAWLVVQGIKPIENRSRAFKHRGPLAIHATGTLYEREYDAACKALGRSIPEDALELGGIIGAVDVVDVVEDHLSRWFRGPYGLLLKNPRPCSFVPVQGQLGIWTVPATLRRRIIF